ncbi:ArsC family reductase [Pseudohongiella sp.]|uniref:Arsenate reductase n=1 Tax=marine sediment metagenome TaxID=412755 RepID=A0A0F9WDV0_9ZZZZ|nr:ArsC family reductase [Pseudohongiella sp.]HDZ09845.1 ArsC family reductase [Pseudohongiella sp.]HEA61541.1 ArsC family reductase [Pseudohongiella sp.]
MITLYGISNCDTVRKSGKWLDAQGIEWTLHDYRKHGLDDALAADLLAAFGAERLINKRGTTWRQLDASEQHKITDPASAIKLMQTYPALIKRPIVHARTHGWLLGYDQLMVLSG